MSIAKVKNLTTTSVTVKGAISIGGAEIEYKCKVKAGETKGRDRAARTKGRMKTEVKEFSKRAINNSSTWQAMSTSRQTYTLWESLSQHPTQPSTAQDKAGPRK